MCADDPDDEDDFPEDESWDDSPPSVPIAYPPIDLGDLPF